MEKLPDFHGDGSIRALLRSQDWSVSSLGHPDTWPPELMTIVQLMLNSTFPMFLAWGPELRLLYNDAYAAILGNKHPAAFGEPFQQVWSEIWTEVSPIIDNALAGNSSYFEDLPLTIIRNGYPEQAWFTFSYSPAKHNGDTIHGIYCTVVETSKRVQIEQRQAFQLGLADLLRDLSAPDDIVAAASHMLGCYLQVARVLYAEIDEASGRFHIRRNWTADGIASVAGLSSRLDDFGSDMIALLRAGQAVRIHNIAEDPKTVPHAAAYAQIGVQAFLAIPLVKSGRLIAVLSLHQSQPYQWRDTEVLLAQEMAERTWAAVEHARAEAELRAERDKSQHVFDSMTEGFAMIDRNWHVSQMNSEGLRIGQRTAAEVLGRNIWEIWPETIGTRLEAIYRHAMENGVPTTFEHCQTFSNGRKLWIEIRIYPSLDRGLAVFYRDIGERKHAEFELQEASRRKDEFLAMLAHELRNPLAPISAAAELMGMVQLDEARLKQTSQIITRQVRHMTGLVDDLLDVSRVTRGLVTLTKSPHEINDIVANAVEQIRPIMEAAHHTLHIDLPAESAWVLGDPKRLVQILTNLLNNAAKYTPEGGIITLRMELSPEYVVLRVIDNGIGIAPEVQPRVFDLFAQADRTADRAQGGLGLGLALVKSLTELHGGQVSCVSEGIGKGSMFTVCLPRLPAQQLDQTRAEHDRQVQKPHKQLRLMIVDDNADAADMLAMFLDASGYHVTVEHGSRRALERAIVETPDVCVLDIGLPDIDGNELARQLRARPETTHAVLIAVTGYGQEHDRQNALAAGFDYHLVKPVDTSRLAALLAEISA